VFPITWGTTPYPKRLVDFPVLKHDPRHCRAAVVSDDVLQHGFEVTALLDGIGIESHAHDLMSLQSVTIGADQAAIDRHPAGAGEIGDNAGGARDRIKGRSPQGVIGRETVDDARVGNHPAVELSDGSPDQVQTLVLDQHIALR
jgi:hypothetical protein